MELASFARFSPLAGMVVVKHLGHLGDGAGRQLTPERRERMCVRCGIMGMTAMTICKIISTLLASDFTMIVSG